LKHISPEFVISEVMFLSNRSQLLGIFDSHFAGVVAQVNLNYASGKHTLEVFHRHTVRILHPDKITSVQG